MGMGLGRDRALSSVRISWGRFTTLTDMDRFLDLLAKSVGVMSKTA
jgi:cysteine sulfinate desulfinase/cysteine desulfurase-like protein